jgi:hypothetical protein
MNMQPAGWMPQQQQPFADASAMFSNGFADMQQRMAQQSSEFASNMQSTQALAQLQRSLGIGKVEVMPGAGSKGRDLLLTFYNGTKLVQTADGALQRQDAGASSADVTKAYDAAGIQQLRRTIVAMTGEQLPDGFSSSVSQDGTSVAIGSSTGSGPGSFSGSTVSSTTTVPPAAAAQPSAAGSSQQQQQQQQQQQYGQQPQAAAKVSNGAAGLKRHTAAWVQFMVCSMVIAVLMAW